jgi:hypothetical protein
MEGKASTVSRPSTDPSGETRLRHPESMTAMLDRIDWASLPPQVQKTIQTLGPLIVAGYSLGQMATSLGQPEVAVRERIAELCEAMLSHAGELEEQLRERAEELRHRGPAQAG